MHHPVLGKLESKNNQNDAYTGEAGYRNRIITIDIELDQEKENDVLILATNVIKSLASLDAKAKSIITNDFLETYNSGWNEYQIEQEDKSFKTIKNPTLSAKKFEEKFKLNSIGITGKTCVELWYQDNGLFWGHSIFVSSLEGVNFNRARAEMFG